MNVMSRQFPQAKQKLWWKGLWVSLSEYNTSACACVAVPSLIFSLSQYVFSLVSSWMMNNKQVGCKWIKFTKGHKGFVCVRFCVCGRASCSLTLLLQGFLEQKNKQKSSHASIPGRGSLKLCVSSALNYWLCKSDRMNKSDTFSWLPQPLCLYFVKQNDNSADGV